MNKSIKKLNGKYFIDGVFVFITYLLDFENDQLIVKLYDYDNNLIIKEIFKEV